MAIDIENKISVTYQLDKDAVSRLKLLASLPSKRHSLAASKTVKLTSEYGALLGESTNLDLWAKMELSSNMSSSDVDLSVLVSVDVIKALKTPKRNETISFSIQSYDETNTVSFGALTSKGVLPVDKFPKTPGDVVSMTRLAALTPLYFEDFNLCSLSAATTEYRPTLTGVCHKGNHMIATDGLRLIKLDSGLVFGDESKSILIPADVSKTLNKMFGKSGAGMFVNDKFVLYQNDVTSLLVRQIEGSYPDIERIINVTNNFSGTIVDVQAWIDVLKQIEPYAKHSDKGISLDLSKNESKVSFKDSQQSIEMSLGFETFNDDVLSISFNPTNLRQALEQTGDNATFIASSGNAPVKIVSQDGRIETLVAPILKR